MTEDAGGRREFEVASSLPDAVITVVFRGQSKLLEITTTYGLHLALSAQRWALFSPCCHDVLYSERTFRTKEFPHFYCRTCDTTYEYALYSSGGELEEGVVSGEDFQLMLAPLMNTFEVVVEASHLRIVVEEIANRGRSAVKNG